LQDLGNFGRTDTLIHGGFLTKRIFLSVVRQLDFFPIGERHNCRIMIRGSFLPKEYLIKNMEFWVLGFKKLQHTDTMNNKEVPNFGNLYAT
jgi:hypothetical protein